MHPPEFVLTLLDSMGDSYTAMYPRLKLPCGDFKACECGRGRPMNFFSLFARNGDRACGTYSRATENKFKVDVRPTFPDPPKKTEQRMSRDQAPSLCIHEQGHIWKRLGGKPVPLDPVPDTLEDMVEKLDDALREADAARAGADVAQAPTVVTATAPAHAPAASGLPQIQGGGASSGALPGMSQLTQIVQQMVANQVQALKDERDATLTAQKAAEGERKTALAAQKATEDKVTELSTQLASAKASTQAAEDLQKGAERLWKAAEAKVTELEEELSVTRNKVRSLEREKAKRPLSVIQLRNHASNPVVDNSAIQPPLKHPSVFIVAPVEE